MWRLAVLSLGALLLSAAVAAGQPRLFEGVAGWEHTLGLQADDGRSGIAVFPGELSGNEVTRIHDPAGFEVRLTNADQPGTELSFTAGTLFDPPRGRYRYWVEGAWSMTPFTQLASFGADRPPGAKSMRVLPIVPAGRVALPERPRADPAHQLRLLYVDREPAAGLRHELSRRRGVAEVGSGILMPAGRVLAALWDPHEERYSALSRPFTVEAKTTVAAPLRGPAEGEADLVVYVDRAEGVPASALPGLVLTATQGREQRRADVSLLTPWGTYGVWYGLKPGTVALGGGNDRLYVPPAAVYLTSGRISRYQGKVLRKILLPDDRERRR